MSKLVNDESNRNEVAELTDMQVSEKYNHFAIQMNEAERRENRIHLNQLAPTDESFLISQLFNETTGDERTFQEKLTDVKRKASVDPQAEAWFQKYRDRLALANEKYPDSDRWVVSPDEIRTIKSELLAVPVVAEAARKSGNGLDPDNYKLKIRPHPIDEAWDLELQTNDKETVYLTRPLPNVQAW